MGIFQRPKFLFKSKKKVEIPEGLWEKCPACGEMVDNVQLTTNLQVCPKCEHHFPVSARARLEGLLDPNSFEERDADMLSVDTLKFQGMASYADRLKTYQEKTGLKDALVGGFGALQGRKVAVGVMDFQFLAATMGAVVGEKITRLVECATLERTAVILFSASGGARM